MLFNGKYWCHNGLLTFLTVKVTFLIQWGRIIDEFNFGNETEKFTDTPL